MTVGELIARLSKFDSNTLVCFGTIEDTSEVHIGFTTEGEWVSWKGKWVMPNDDDKPVFKPTIIFSDGDEPDDPPVHYVERPRGWVKRWQENGKIKQARCETPKWALGRR